MALSRAMLKGMNLTDEQVNAIIEEHDNTIDGLKKVRDQYKEQAEKLPQVQKELDKLKKESEDSTSGMDEWKKKYDAEHENFEKYKKEVSDKETKENIKSAYRKLLTECKVGSKHIDSILRVTDFSSMKLAEDGSLEDVEKMKESINSEWSGFITSEGVKGAKVETPPDKDETSHKGTSRAAELAAKYHDNLYGSTSKEG